MANALPLFLLLLWVLPNDAVFTSDIRNLEKRVKELEKNVFAATPFLSVCASSSGTELKRYQDITYEKVFHSSTNLKEGGLDTCSGVFTSGVSGTYSVSWSGYSDARGGGTSVALRKNGNYINEAECTWTLQGRSIVLDLEKGDTLVLRYDDFNDYGYEKINFCVSLVQAHEIHDLEEREVNILPPPDKVEEGENIFDLILKPSFDRNDDRFIKKVKAAFDANSKANSRDCKDDVEERTCEESCNNFGFKKCSPGCKFDHKLLGECAEPPYGLYKFRHHNGEISINPCFFFQFETSNFLNLSQQSPNTVQCKASLEFDEYDLLSKVDRNSLSRKQKESIQFFLKNKKVFEDMGSFKEYDLRSLKVLKFMMDGIKFMKMVEAKPDNFSSIAKVLKKKYDEEFPLRLLYRLGEGLEGIKVMNTLLTEDEKETKMLKISRGFPFTPDICIQDPALCAMYDLFHGNKIMYEHTEVLTADIAMMENDNDTELDADVLATVKELIANNSIINPNLKGEDERLLKSLKYVGDFSKYMEVSRILLELKTKYSGIRTEIFPPRGSIPAKYFPLNGEEESPIIAVKVYMEEKSWVTPGQVVILTCNVMYDGFDGRKRRRRGGTNPELGPGGIKLKLVLR